MCFAKRTHPLFNELNNNQTHGVLIKRPQWIKMMTSPLHQIANIEVDHVKIKEPKVTATADALSRKSISKWFDLKKRKFLAAIQQDMLKNEVDILIKQERSFSKALFKKN